MKEVRVLMCGPSRVGKTSALASMASMFADEVFKTELRLHAEPDTAAQLHDRWSELVALPLTIEREPAGIVSTAEPRTYAFEFGVKRESPTLRLVFEDIPGGYLQKKPDAVMERLERACAVVLPIDTPALMESRGDWSFLHNKHNAPRLIADMFHAGYKSLAGPRLVILVPMRCERYLHTPADAAGLLARVEEGYGEVLEVLSSKPEVAVVVAPVQTIGSVAFSHIGAVGAPQLKPRADSYDFFFRRTSPEATYAPKDAEQPLRYLMRFLMHEHLVERRRGGFGALVGEFAREVLGVDIWPTWVGEVFDEIEGNAAFRRAVPTFAGGCKEAAPFAVLQGRDWLG